MTLLATQKNRFSNVVKSESMPQEGFCRKEATVTIESGMDIGSALVLASGKYVWIAASMVGTLADDVAILVEFVKDVPSLTAGDYTLTVMHRGPSVVSNKGITFKDTLTTNQKATVYAKLEAKNIAVRTGI